MNFSLVVRVRHSDVIAAMVATAAMVVMVAMLITAATTPTLINQPAVSDVIPAPFGTTDVILLVVNVRHRHVIPTDVA